MSRANCKYSNKFILAFLELNVTMELLGRDDQEACGYAEMESSKRMLISGFTECRYFRDDDGVYFEN